MLSPSTSATQDIQREIMMIAEYLYSQTETLANDFNSEGCFCGCSPATWEGQLQLILSQPVHMIKIVTLFVLHKEIYSVILRLHGQSLCLHWCYIYPSNAINNLTLSSE